MLYLTEISGILAELFCINIYLQAILRPEKDPSFLWSIVGYCLFGLVNAVSSICIRSSFVNIACSLAGMFLLSYLVYKVSPLHATFASLSFMAIVALLDVIIMAMLSGFGFNSQDLLSDYSIRIIYIIVEHMVLLGLVSIISAFASKGRGIISKKTVILLLPCWAVSILLCCILCSEVTIMHRTLTPWYLIVTLGLLYTNIASIYIIKKVSAQELYMQQNELAEHHYAMEREYYQQLHEHQAETRALWHDIDKYYLAMQAALSNADQDEAKETMKAVKNLIGESKDIVNVNNTTVSVILNRYIKIANDSDIRVTLDVQVPPVLFVAASDLYIIIGNTMDNAIDACLNLPTSERFIELKMKTRNEILFYMIRNSFDPDHPVQHKNRFHGYGLKNVRKCINKYKGTMQTATGGKIFTFTAHMNSV